jgi:hypothetical protein
MPVIYIIDMSDTYQTKLINILDTLNYKQPPSYTLEHLIS